MKEERNRRKEGRKEGHRREEQELMVKKRGQRRGNEAGMGEERRLSKDTGRRRRGRGVRAQV